MIDVDNTIVAEGLTNFCRSLGKKRFKISKQMARNILKNTGRALEIGANIGTAFVSRRSPKAALSSIPEVINFYHTGEDFYLSNFVYFLLHKWNKKHQEKIHLHH